MSKVADHDCRVLALVMFEVAELVMGAAQHKQSCDRTVFVSCGRRDCERLVRSKLLARKLGYHPAHQQQGPGGNSSNGPQRESDHQIEEMMLAAVMTAPEGLGSWQHRAAVEALIDQNLDQLVSRAAVAVLVCMSGRQGWIYWEGAVKYIVC